MDHLPDSFADHPETIGERRAERADGNAIAWTPRDALISLLRDMDADRITPAGLFIAFFEEPAPGSTRTGFRNATRSPIEAMGLIEMGRQRFWQS